MLHKATTQMIIGAAMNVLNELKPGLGEKVYENALVLELNARGATVDQQRQFPVHYHGTLVGNLIPDLIVDDKVIIDTKVVTAFTDSHLAQMVGYLAITELQVGLLINFKYAKLGWKRVLRDMDQPAANDDPHPCQSV
jgi:GxxExxY protein